MKVCVTEFVYKFLQH